MASPPEISLLNLPGVRLIVSASALLPACSLILAISACETVLSAVTTTRLVLLSTAQAVPGMSALSTELLALLSSAVLNGVAAVAFALGTAMAAAATRPVVPAISRVRLAMPLRGVVRLILTFRSLPGEVGGPRGVGAREAQSAVRRPDFEHAVPLTSAEGEYSAERPVGARAPFGRQSLKHLCHPAEPAVHRTVLRSPAVTATPRVFPGGGNGQMKWSAKAQGGSSARLKSTVVRPSASGAEGYRNRNRQLPSPLVVSPKTAHSE